MNRIVRALSVGVVCLWGVWPGSADGQSATPPNPPPAGVMTLEDASARLKLFPRDACQQYIVMKLAQRAGLEPSTILGPDRNSDRRAAIERRENVDLFSIFSGALAVQESLQLDAMRARGEQTRPPEHETVALSELKGPTVQSHPWQVMLAGRTPAVSPLMQYIPEDQYLISFRSVGKLLDVIDTGDLFAKHLLSQAGEPAWKRDTEYQLKRQLAVETNPLARPFYDLVVKEIAITGSDPFVTEGSDVTLLFRYEQEPVFKAQMEAYLKSAEKAVPGVVRKEAQWEGIPYVHLTSPDRAVHVYSAYPAKGVHIRSNSLPGLQRVLGLVQGKPGKGVTSLGESQEFAYIRTLMPDGAAEEDGLIYLSDPFIRKLVGPQLKITELRRLRCFNHLKMIEFASAMHRMERGNVPKTLAELATADCLPNGFGKELLTCPCGGKHSLSADGKHAQCSHHGHSERLIPCDEIPVANATQSEAEAYEAFEQQYSQYWRTFFDPIAIRIRSTPESYRVETIVLPLIENTVYQSMAMAFGGEAKAQSHTVTADTILSMNFSIDKARLLEQSGWPPPPPELAAAEATSQVALAQAQQQSTNNLRQIAIAMHNFHDTFNNFPAAAKVDAQGKPLLSWRVQILPYLDQAELYNQFHLDEPWDSPHNILLLPKLPAVYRSPGVKGLKPGTTTYLTVVDENSAFPPNGKTSKIARLTDGTSNTIMVLDAAIEHAVDWTKPDDLPLDMEVLKHALQSHFRNGGLVAMCDGSVGTLMPALSDETLRDLFVCNDGHILGDVIRYAPSPNRSRDPLALHEMTGGHISERDVYEFAAQGLGESVSLHVCDSAPQLDVQMSSILGQMLGSTGRGGRGFEPEFFMAAMAITSINSPVYLRVALDDIAIADRFLEKLDKAMATVVRIPTNSGFFEVEKDYYATTTNGTKTRAFVLSFGPIRWRFFYTRIGQSMVVSTQHSILEELSQLEAQLAKAPSTPSHASLAIHRSHWRKIMPSVRMTWNESARHSCLDNLGHLGTAARTMLPDARAKANAASLLKQAAEIYGVHHYCPAGGSYTLRADQQCQCSLHGTVEEPTQPSLDDTSGVAQQVLTNFQDARFSLTFLPEGLHAVLELDRTIPAKTPKTP